MAKGLISQVKIGQNPKISVQNVNNFFSNRDRVEIPTQIDCKFCVDDENATAEVRTSIYRKNFPHREYLDLEV